MKPGNHEAQKIAKTAKGQEKPHIATGAQPCNPVRNTRQPIAEAEAEVLIPRNSAQIPIPPLKSDSKTKLTPAEENKRKNYLLNQLKKT